MQYLLILIVFVSLFVGCSSNDKSEETVYPTITVNIPTTYMDTSIIDDYHGVKVSDPYRWLEDDNSPETKAWVAEENKATFAYLDQIPFRATIHKRLSKLWNYEKFGNPFKRGNNYYYFKNDGLQNQSVLYSQADLDAESSIVLDPNKLSEDGTTSLGSISFSEDGKYLAYSTSEGGSDWNTAYVLDLTTGETLSDKVNWIKFSGLSWKDNGFYYSRYPTPKEGDELSASNLFHSVYYHKIGTDQSADQVVYSDRSNPEYNFYASTTDDERYLVLNTARSTSGNQLAFKDLSKPSSNFTQVVKSFDNDFHTIGSEGDELFVLTNYKAPKWRLIAINTNKPSENNWREVLPTSEHVLKSVSMIGGKLFATSLKDASSSVSVYNMDGTKAYDVKLPSIGTVGGFSGRMEDEIAFYQFTNFTRPASIYKLDVADGKSEIFKSPTIDFDSDAYETKQVFFNSKDGTKVPIFITHKKGLEMDGKRPTLLYGYGGFDISITPSFSLSKSVLLENDGIFAVANIRGGGEYGAEWHEAGTKENKQNVFDDFIGAAEYLINHNYTDPNHIAIEGRSNGGLLVGACMTQRPDLYAVCFPGVGVLDMLRYDKFTIGRAWAADYGLSETPEGFEYLYAYSPLHNVKDVAYPATMVTTADHDDRVVPAHSFKFISELQRHNQGDNPVLIRIETSAGHGAGKPTAKQIDEATDLMSFLFYNTNAPVKY